MDETVGSFLPRCSWNPSCKYLARSHREIKCRLSSSDSSSPVEKATAVKTCYLSNIAVNIVYRYSRPLPLSTIKTAFLDHFIASSVDFMRCPYNGC